MVSGWSRPGFSKVYRNKKSAYYMIAKRIILAKYPAGLIEGAQVDVYDDELNAQGYGETLDIPYVPYYSAAIECNDSRYDKAAALFANDNGSFSTSKWKRFVRRLAKYLEYLDSKTNEPVLPPGNLQKIYERAETLSTEWAQVAAVAQSKLRLEK